MTAMIGKLEGPAQFPQGWTSDCCIAETTLMVFVMTNFHRDLKGIDPSLNRNPFLRNREAQ